MFMPQRQVGFPFQRMVGQILRIERPPTASEVTLSVWCLSAGVMFMLEQMVGFPFQRMVGRILRIERPPTASEITKSMGCLSAEVMFMLLVLHSMVEYPFQRMEMEQMRPSQIKPPPTDWGTTMLMVSSSAVPMFIPQRQGGGFPFQRMVGQI